jgi:hypothetical protein
MTEQQSQLRRWDDAAQWDEWVRRSPQYSIFATSRFLAALKVEAHRWVLYRGGEPQVAALVLTRNGQVVRAPHPFTMYQGIFYCGDATTMALHRRPRWELDVTTELLLQLSRRYDSLSFGLHHSIADARSFQWFNYHDAEQGQFTVSLRYTGRVRAAPLADPQVFLASIRESRRRDQLKAVKNGLTVAPSKSTVRESVCVR